MDETLERMLRLRELMKTERGRAGSPNWQKEVDALREQVDADLLRRFDHLIERGRAPVGLLSDSGACGTCHLNLTRDQVLHMRNSPRRGFPCPYCGCLLYVAKALETS